MIPPHLLSPFDLSWHVHANFWRALQQSKENKDLLPAGAMPLVLIHPLPRFSTGTFIIQSQPVFCKAGFAFSEIPFSCARLSQYAKAEPRLGRLMNEALNNWEPIICWKAPVYLPQFQCIITKDRLILFGCSMYVRIVSIGIIKKTSCLRIVQSDCDSCRVVSCFRWNSGVW